ncbi:MAG TPA: phasin family protein [Stenomitos sp.]
MDTNNFLKQMLLIGVGTTSFVADKVREVSEEWVREGRLNPDQARAFVDDLMQQMRTDPTEWEGQVQRQLRNIMQDLGLARQSEMDELRGRIDRLERQVRDLENKLWR